jgi:hypothetical protein
MDAIQLPTDEELVRAQYPNSAIARKPSKHGTRYQVITRAMMGRPTQLGNWTKTVEGAWKSAADRIRSKERQAHVAQQLQAIKNKRTPLVKGPEPQA